MAIKDTDESQVSTTTERENKSPILKELLHSNRKRPYESTEPDHLSASYRNRTEIATTTPRRKRGSSSPNSNIKRLLSVPPTVCDSRLEYLSKTGQESPTKDESAFEIKPTGTGTTERTAEEPVIESEILDPTPVTAPVKDAAIRCLLDLPRLDQRQAAEKAVPMVMPMPRHDPVDSPMMTQLKLHLAYAFHKLARNSMAPRNVSSHESK